MKKIKHILALFLFCCFIISGCSCNNKEPIDNETALNVLHAAKIDENVTVMTTTKTIVDNKESISTQVDTYYDDIYYHTSEGEDLSTKTWYGYIEDVLYAFYYTKNANNEEVKSSTRIDKVTLESAQKQPNFIINTLFNEDNTLMDKYVLNAFKQGNIYTLNIYTSTEEETDSYEITLNNNRITKIVNKSNLGNDYVETTYDYTYDIENIQLPTLEEYPLIVNN